MVQVVGGRLTCQWANTAFTSGLSPSSIYPSGLSFGAAFNSVRSVTFFSLYEEAAITSESVIGCLAFASVMSFSSCFSHYPFALKAIKPCGTVGKRQSFPFPIQSNGAELCNQHIVRSRVYLSRDWSFIGGSKVVVKPKVTRLVHYPKGGQIHASWFSGSQLASNVFTLGTVAVLPFYTLMVLAPKSELTKKSMESSIPYLVLGVLYAYLLYLSWTPETVRLIFASKYLLPELTSIGKMFSSELTLASAWIHLLVVDLFAARHVFQDGLENQIETRHSVSFCLFFCPIGILTHVITKAMTKTTRKEGHGL